MTHRYTFTVPMVVGLVVLSTTPPLRGQTPEEIEAEPIVKLQPGATAVPGQCLTQQELDLVHKLNALRRPTVGVEGVEQGDDAAPFDPHYFVGPWSFEGVLPDSPLGKSGDFVGTETVHHVHGCTYESVLEATIADEPVTISSRMIYDRDARYLLRIENDSRGFELLKMGRVGGDSGGFFSHHWETPSVSYAGEALRLQGRTSITSPFAYRLQLRLAIGNEPFTNFGSIWWDRLDDTP